MPADPSAPLAPSHRLLALAATVAAARAAARTVGLGDAEAADRAAVDAMRASLAEAPADLHVAIGEGERDEAPMLHSGERLGRGGDALDLALDPLECTTVAAEGGAGSMSVLALAARGRLLTAPDVYMEKLAFGPSVPEDALDLDMAPADLVAALARALSLPASEVRVCVLARPRHEALLEGLRSAGCRVHLTPDGDVAACLAVASPHPAHHAYVGTGGAPEGVLSAAALRCLGGRFQGRLAPRGPAEEARVRAAGIEDPRRRWRAEELAGGDLVFAATGVTSGPTLDGVCATPSGDWTESLLLAAPPAAGPSCAGGASGAGGVAGAAPGRPGEMHRLRSFHPSGP